MSNTPKEWSLGVRGIDLAGSFCPVSRWTVGEILSQVKKPLPYVPQIQIAATGRRPFEALSGGRSGR